MRLRQGCSGAWLALLAAAADRATKALALSAGDGALIPGVLRVSLVYNTGAAFSGLSGRGALLSVLTALVIGGLLAWLLARPELPKLGRAGLWLIVGGGLGNLFDRLRYGHVIDFLEPAFVRFAVFNVADACICVGAALAFLGFALDERRGRKTDGQ